MASLSSKRKMIANRQLQHRDSAKRAGKAAATVRPSDSEPLTIAVPTAAEFCEERYGQARSRYQHLLGGANEMTDVRQLMRTIVQHEFDAGGRDAALEMRPYILKYVNEQRHRASASR